MKTVSVIGSGRIGSALVQGIDALDTWQLGKVLTRQPRSDHHNHTTDQEAFLSHPADLIIETAGPDALRAYGPKALAAAPLWSVGAVALADHGLRERLASVSRSSGHHLRLFACGMANMPLSAQRLRITMRAPEIDSDWAGPLTQAIALWPNRLNTAVAAALNGPGLDATDLAMERGRPDTLHEIEVEAEAGSITWRRTIRFDMRPEVPHPVAQMLLSELAREGRFWQGI